MNTKKTTKQPQLAFLRGKRLVLRPLLRSDVPFLLRWINDPDVRQFLASNRPKSERFEEEWVDSQGKDNENVVFVMETKKGAPIGTMGLHNIDWISGTAQTGAMIGEKRYWNKGYGSEAKMLLLEYSFSVLNLRRIYSTAYGFNGRSIAYSKKCGYVVESRIRKNLYRNGKYHDKVILVITRNRFFKLKKGK